MGTTALYSKFCDPSIIIINPFSVDVGGGSKRQRPHMRASSYRHGSSEHSAPGPIRMEVVKLRGLAATTCGHLLCRCLDKTRAAS